MQFKDALYPSDTIEATIRNGRYGPLVDIEIQGCAGAGCIYLTKEDAAALGRLLIELFDGDELRALTIPRRV